MKNISIKLAKVLIPLTLIFATLFYLSDINFQLEHFKIMGFLKMLLFLVVPVLLTAIINSYMSRKALKNRKQDDRLE
jgi:cytochrome c oxidase subunit IV